ncbi:arginase family protein [Patescibacteria group bacterium]|nr:arginase family protein [Patescibacteria group bacterium]
MFIVKVPGINSSGKTNGCEKSGNLILSNLKEISNNEKGNLIDTKLLDLEEIHLDNSNLELTNKLIYENSLEIFEEKPKTIFLGGDHSISYSITLAFLDYCKKIQKEPGLVVFDSSPNCFESGSKFPKNKEWVNQLIKTGFPPENIFLVGIRNFSSSEISFLKKRNLKFMLMNPFHENLEDSCDTIMEFLRDKESYVSIDLSIIDPAFAPGVSFKEPGGLTSREFLYVIQRINLLKNLRGVDIVEINPEKDMGDLTVKLGAKILSELI